MELVYNCAVCGGSLYCHEQQQGFRVESKPAHERCAAVVLEYAAKSSPPITDEALCRLGQIFHEHQSVKTLQYPDNLIAEWIKHHIGLLRGTAP